MYWHIWIAKKFLFAALFLSPSLLWLLIFGLDSPPRGRGSFFPNLYLTAGLGEVILFNLGVVAVIWVLILSFRMRRKNFTLQIERAEFRRDDDLVEVRREMERDLSELHIQVGKLSQLGVIALLLGVLGATRGMFELWGWIAAS